jgi:hypothetical protein
MPQQAVDIAGGDVVAGADARIELFQDFAGSRTGFGGSAQCHHVAVHVRLYAEAVLDQCQMTVILAKQPAEVAIVLEGHDYARVRDLRRFAHVNCRGPTHARQLGSLPNHSYVSNPYPAA